MDTSEIAKKIDLKQIGGGAIGSFLILFLMQDKGIDLMSKKHQADDNVVIEKTVANKESILETKQELKELKIDFKSFVEKMDTKLLNQFESVREEIRRNDERFSEIIRVAGSDRFTKSQQTIYSDGVQRELDTLKDSNKDMKHKLRQLESEILELRATKKR